jgi:SAM-dependent methyltransferase
MDLDKLLSSNEPRSIYYSLIAGGARAKLLESIIESKLFDLYKHKSINSESYIINSLKLHPLRAKKWLHLLANEKFLEQTEKDNEYHYALGILGKAIFNEDSEMQSMCNHVVYTWKWVASNDLNAILHGGEPNFEYNWPPKTSRQAFNFEKWMAQTSYQPIYALESTLDIAHIKNMLDVGGGDGTVACALARLNPKIKITVYNLPHSAELARKKIASSERTEQVNVYEGDFLKDKTFPTGYDYILFCRVLWDWSLATDRKLLQMAYDALPPGGHVAICEAFRETYQDFALGEEYRYILWNDVEVALFKTTDEYISLLTEIGFKNIILHINEKISIYSLILAQKPS